MNIRRPPWQIRRLPWLLERLIANERKFLKRYDVPLPTLLRLWRNGYFSYCGVLYDTNRLDLYLSDIEQHRTQRINGSMGEILRNKYIAKQFLKEEFSDNLPETYAIVRNSRFESLSADVKSLDRLVDSVGPVVCKPVSGGRGEGVHVVETPKEAAKVEPSLSDHIIVERIQQHEFEESVFPASLNTMRIVTMVDPDTDELNIGVATHRFGVDASAPTDNWSAGGIAAQIDVDTGKLGAAVHAHGSEKRWLSNHPETGTRIEGKTVPNWQAVRHLALSASGELAEILPYIGWDIAVSSSSVPIIIEGNRASDVDIMQMHEPLLADDRRRRFYEYHGVI